MPGEEITKSKVIDWSKVLTNAISLLVATVFVGAAVALWNKADNIKTQIIDATVAFNAQEHEFSHEIAGLNVALVELREQLQQFAESVRPDPPATGAKTWFPGPEPRHQQIESERKRIIGDIQKRQAIIDPRLRIAPNAMPHVEED